MIGFGLVKPASTKLVNSVEIPSLSENPQIKFEWANENIRIQALQTQAHGAGASRAEVVGPQAQLEWKKLAIYIAFRQL